MLWDTAGQEEFDCITRAYYRSVSSHIVNGDLWPLKYTGLVWYESDKTQKCEREVTKEPWNSVGGMVLVLQKVASELHPKVRNHGEGPY